MAGTGTNVADLSASLGGESPPLVIDVRRREAYSKDTKTVSGAMRRDPEQVSSWGAELPPASKVVVFCVHGHEVSQGVAKALREQGRDASYLEGGLAAWVEAGGSVGSKPAAE